jgi:hypothetical protein
MFTATVFGSGRKRYKLTTGICITNGLLFIMLFLKGKKYQNDD